MDESFCINNERNHYERDNKCNYQQNVKLK